MTASCVQSQSYGKPCARFSDDYFLLYGLYGGYAIPLLDNSVSTSDLPRGKRFIAGLTGELYDPNAVVNFRLHISYQHTAYDLSNVDGLQYNINEVSFAPGIKYSPCLFKNYVGVELNPFIYSLRLGNLETLNRSVSSFGAKIFYNVRFYDTTVSSKPTFVPYHLDVYLSYQANYSGNSFFNEDLVNGFDYSLLKANENVLSFGVIVYFNFEY